MTTTAIAAMAHCSFAHAIDMLLVEIERLRRKV
jgi:hypothetical protein